MHGEVDRRDCISIGLHSGHQCLFTFQLSFDSLILNMPTSDIHLSGFRSIFYVYEAGIDCHAVTKLLRSFHTLRVIHFDFVSNYHVEAAGLSWPVLLAPPLQYCEFVLTPARRDPSGKERPFGSRWSHCGSADIRPHWCVFVYLPVSVVLRY